MGPASSSSTRLEGLRLGEFGSSLGAALTDPSPWAFWGQGHVSQHHGGGSKSPTAAQGASPTFGRSRARVLWRHPAGTQGHLCWDVPLSLGGTSSQILVLPWGQCGQDRALCRKDPACIVWDWLWLFGERRRLRGRAGEADRQTCCARGDGEGHSNPSGFQELLFMPSTCPNSTSPSCTSQTYSSPKPKPHDST